MSLLQQIKTDQLQARKNRDADSTSLLTTLLGEASMPGKNDGNRESTDDEVVAIVKKFIKNNNEVIAAAPNADISVFESENGLLENYLPQQLNDDELGFIISDIIAELGEVTIKDMGRVMGALKQDHSGKYDGKLASNIIKDLLS